MCAWSWMCAWVWVWVREHGRIGDACVCMYVCIGMFIYMYCCVCLYMYVCGYTCMCPCACVGVNRVFIFICMCWLRATAFHVCLVSFEPNYRRPRPDPDSCSLWTRYNDDLKTVLWDDPSISTGSCSEDQTAIRFWNCVISCECSLLCIYRCRYALHVDLIISCNFLLYFTSLITFITSWDIHDCPLYSCNWYLLVLALFHALVVYRCWLRPSFDTP